MKKLIHLPLVGLIILMASCGQQNNAENETEDQSSTPAPETEATSEDSANGETVKVEITGNDQMKFNKTEIRVKAGQTVELTLKHVGQLPAASMGHNWVLLKQGADLEAFAMDAIQARDNDYIPEGRKDDIIANTKMLGGGESETITFQAPAKGTYTFLCSFPGHYMVMNGKFIVE